MGSPRKEEQPEEKKKLQRKKESFDNALSSDPEFMKKHLTDTKRVYDVNLATLEDIRDGKVMDCQYDPKTGHVIDKPVSIDVRVKAIAQINAMTLHKVMADKRDPGREKDSGKGINHEESLKRVMSQIEKEKAEKKQQVEDKAVQDGKLVKLGKANQ